MILDRNNEIIYIVFVSYNNYNIDIQARTQSSVKGGNKFVRGVWGSSPRKIKKKKVLREQF